MSHCFLIGFNVSCKATQATKTESLYWFYGMALSPFLKQSVSHQLLVKLVNCLSQKH